MTISRVINRAFRPAIRAIAAEGGTILSFGGDAVFAMFDGGGAVKRAEAAAEAVREHFWKRGRVATSGGLVELSVSQAVHFGTVRELHLEGERRDAGRGGRAAGVKASDFQDSRGLQTTTAIAERSSPPRSRR